ncbi:MAG: WbqC family protein [Rikenellaceae bacterium]
MILLPTSYFGNIEYYSKLLTGEPVEIEIYENFPKQTYRNRMLIMTANGVIPIIVPLKRSRGGKIMTKDIEIDYSMQWQQGAWRAIVSAYRNSAYFDHFEQKIEPFFHTRFESLIEMNNKIVETILPIIGGTADIKMTSSYVHNSEGEDLRSYFTPKSEQQYIGKPYYQVFSDRLAFTGNLSILDLIFCEGSNAIEYVTIKK